VPPGGTVIRQQPHRALHGAVQHRLVPAQRCQRQRPHILGGHAAPPRLAPGLAVEQRRLQLGQPVEPPTRLRHPPNQQLFVRISRIERGAQCAEKARQIAIRFAHGHQLRCIKPMP